MHDMKVRGRAAGYNTGRLGEETNNSKLTLEQVKEIKEELLQIKRGTISRLTDKYGVSRGCIRSILSGQSWGYV
jgi:hypothetical protein